MRRIFFCLYLTTISLVLIPTISSSQDCDSLKNTRTVIAIDSTAKIINWNFFSIDNNDVLRPADDLGPLGPAIVFPANMTSNDTTIVLMLKFKKDMCIEDSTNRQSVYINTQNSSLVVDILQILPVDWHYLISDSLKLATRGLSDTTFFKTSKLKNGWASKKIWFGHVTIKRYTMDGISTLKVSDFYTASGKKMPDWSTSIFIGSYIPHRINKQD